MRVTPPRYTSRTLDWTQLPYLWILCNGSENLEALQELRSGGVMGLMYDSAIVEELKCGGVVGLVGPTMLVLRSG